jgi:hypothetical protein
MNIQCPQCKIVNAPDARFCKNCGAAFALLPVKTNNNSIKPLFWLLGLLGLALFIGGVGIINESSNDKAQVASQANFAPQTIQTATPLPTLAELKSETDRLLKLNIDDYDFADLKPFDKQLDLLRAVPKESKDYAQAQAMFKKLIKKTAPVAAANALLGAKPESSTYDGRVEPVVRYLKATMNDYEDSEWIEWSPVFKLKRQGELFWAVRLKLRGKNAFGAKILKNMLFYIRNNEVVATQDLPF